MCYVILSHKGGAIVSKNKAARSPLHYCKFRAKQ